MIRFKKLLTEAKKADELADLLKTGRFWGVNLDRRFYRGIRPDSRAHTETFQAVPIRKDRRSLNTHPFIDELVEQVRKRYYSEIASRRRSAFISPKIDIARGYGEIYYVFVKKSANAWWSSNDAYTDFFTESRFVLDDLLSTDAPSNYDEFVSQEIQNDEELSKFFDFFKALTSKNKKQAIQIAAENFDILHDIEYVFRLNQNPHLREIARDIVEMMEPIKSYHDSLKEYDGSTEHQFIHELIVEDDEIIVANKKWFDVNVDPIL